MKMPQFVGVFATAALSWPVLAQAFVGIGFSAGQTQSQATAISSDGSTVVGWSPGQPWRWSLLGGRQSLTAAPTGYNLALASDVSGNGQVIVGYMNNASQSFAFRWTSATGVERVFGVRGAFGPAVSADGSTIVGTAEGLSITQAVRWTQSTGTVPIGPITGLPISDGASRISLGVSANGSIVVGVGEAVYSTNPVLTTSVPFRWTQATGAIGLLDNGQFYLPQIGAAASDISADGSVVVGYAGAGVWRWTATSGFSLVLNPPATPGTFYPRVSADGSTIAYRHLLWTASGGEVSLTTALTSAGCNITGWTNIFATDVSGNGRALCGYGTNPAGQTEAWYATIPAPGVSPLLVVAGVWTARRRRG